jgi:hypothetical protein
MQAFLAENNVGVAGTVSKAVTFLCCTPADLSAQTSKVRSASKNGTPAVSEGHLYFTVIVNIHKAPSSSSSCIIIMHHASLSTITATCPQP